MRWTEKLLPLLLLATAAACSSNDPDPNDAGGDAATDGSRDADGDTDGGSGDADSPVDTDLPDADSVDDAGGSDADGLDADGPLPPLRDDALDPDFRWDRKAALLIDSTALAAAFGAAGYTLPAGTEVYAVRIIEGLEGPAYLLFEAGDGAFSTDFCPASTVKVLSSVGALDFVGTLGFTGAATVTFVDTGFTDTLRAISDRAIRVSSNEDYDRTVRVAGFDRLNDEVLTGSNGFPATVIQRSYTGTGVRLSPAMELSEGGSEHTVAARDGVGADRCPPRDGNCANLFELTEGIRRLLLHDEIPAPGRFDLAAADVAALVAALCGSSSSYIRPGAEAAFGSDIRLCNKTGTVIGDDYLDHGFLEDPSTGDRFLIALSLPEQGSYSVSVGAAERVAQQTLAALPALAAEAPALQPDAGVPITVQLDDRGSTPESRRAYTLTVEAPDSDRVEIFADRWRLGEAPADTGARFVLDHDFSDGGDRLLIVRAFRGDTLVGYRSLAVHINTP